MITITIKLFGTLRRFSQTDTPGLWRGEIPEGTSLLELIEKIGSTEAEVAGATVNEVFVPLDFELTEDAEIRLVTHMGGGSIN